MNEEIDSLNKNETWSLSELPPGRSAIRSRWVYKLKQSGAEAVKYKARLVAKGFSQKKGVDYEETYSPVVKHDSLRTVLAVAAAKDLEMVQLDVKTAFLNGELEEELFMEQPAGFEVNGRENEVCRLQRSLYGLKQASRNWNKKFDSFIVKYGFTRGVADPCVYYQKDDDQNITIMAIWVDDGLLCSSQASKLKDIVSFLSSNFEMTFGPVGVFVGIQIGRNRQEKLIHISQKLYIEKVVKRFGLSDCKPRSIPADPFSHLMKDSSAGVEASFPFREAVGSLMFAAICTRPDIAFAVNQVAQFSNNPNQSHWEAVKRIITYLKGTSDHGITYCGAGENVLTAYTDADFAGDVDTRRPTTGNIFIINGGPVAWSSQRQRCVSLSTTEAEYVAASTATKEIAWLRNLLNDIGCCQHQPTPLLCDNQSAIRLVRNPEFHQRTKHIDVKFHYIRNMQEEGAVNILYVDTSNQLADALTKALTQPMFVKFKSCIGMSSSVVFKCA